MNAREERTALMGIIWGVFALLVVATMIFTGGNFIIILVLAIAALISTEKAVASINTGSRGEESVEKLKRGSGISDTEALLNLLDADDLAELRYKVKQRLLDRIEGSGDGELSTLDALLAEQEAQHNRS